MKRIVLFKQKDIKCLLLSAISSSFGEDEQLEQIV